MLSSNQTSKAFHANTYELNKDYQCTPHDQGKTLAPIIGGIPCAICSNAKQKQPTILDDSRLKMYSCINDIQSEANIAMDNIDHLTVKEDSSTLLLKSDCGSPTERDQCGNPLEINCRRDFVVSRNISLNFDYVQPHRGYSTSRKGSIRCSGIFYPTVNGKKCYMHTSYCAWIYTF